MLQKQPIESFSSSPFSLIGKEWMLITAGNPKEFNTMTASWGGLGVLWNKPVATLYIRPQRYTKEFVEKNEQFTLSFFDSSYKKALSYCGTHSGRDVDKMKETGLVPEALGESVAFKQAKMVLLCKKLYQQDMEEGCFLDTKLIKENYPQNDLHRIYIGEILEMYTGE